MCLRLPRGEVGDESADHIHELMEYMKHCGGFSWQGVLQLLIHGIWEAFHLPTAWLLAALPLLPQTLPHLTLWAMELSQELLDALGERWGGCLKTVSLQVNWSQCMWPHAFSFACTPAPSAHASRLCLHASRLTRRW